MTFRGITRQEAIDAILASRLEVGAPDDVRSVLDALDAAGAFRPHPGWYWVRCNVPGYDTQFPARHLPDGGWSALPAGKDWPDEIGPRIEEPTT